MYNKNLTRNHRILSMTWYIAPVHFEYHTYWFCSEYYLDHSETPKVLQTIRIILLNHPYNKRVYVTITNGCWSSHMHWYKDNILQLICRIKLRFISIFYDTNVIWRTPEVDTLYIIDKCTLSLEIQLHLAKFWFFFFCTVLT